MISHTLSSLLYDLMHSGHFFYIMLMHSDYFDSYRKEKREIQVPQAQEVPQDVKVKLVTQALQ